MIKLSKQVFCQGEFIHVRISPPTDIEKIVEASVSLIGVESVEFTIQSLLGKKGFHPTWNFLLPSKHLKEETEFLTQIQPIEDIETLSSINVVLEVPENAIPSYYGTNCRVEYRILLDIVFENGKKLQNTKKILIDSSYRPTDHVEKLEFDNGFIELKMTTPLIIGTENVIFLTIRDLIKYSPLRLVLARKEVVKASNIIIEGDQTELPLGQVDFNQDICKVPIKFQIPSDYQHNYKGLFSRAEYSIKLYHIQKKKKFLTTAETLKLMNEITINLEYPVREYLVSEIQ